MIGRIIKDGIKLVVVVIILLVIVSSVVVYFNRQTTSTFQTTSTTLVSGCIDSPNEAGITCSYLSQQAIVWKPASNTSIGWSVITSFGYDNIGHSAVDQANLNMLLQTGASCIRVDIGYDAWLNNNQTTINEMTNLISQIKNAGKCLIIADASAESYRNNQLSWSQFKVVWIQRVQTLAQLYKPNFYVVIKEPGWYYPMISYYGVFNGQLNSGSIGDWVNLTRSLTNTVISVSPNTKIGVSIQGGLSSSAQTVYTNYLQQVSGIPNIDFIGFDQYGSNDQSLDISILSQLSTTKYIWIAECWSISTPQSAFDSTRSSLDAYWLQVEYYYGLYIHAVNIEPFYDAIFASYSIPTDYTMRTPIFYEYQHLATIYGGIVS